MMILLAREEDLRTILVVIDDKKENTVNFYY